jgi:hypothetical protein
MITTEHSTEGWREAIDLWALYSQYNFDTDKLTLNFSPAEVYPWAGGDFTVRIPWDALRSYLDLRLRESPIGSLLSQHG